MDNARFADVSLRSPLSDPDELVLSGSLLSRVVESHVLPVQWTRGPRMK